jgi:hypothetical protein
MMGPWLSLAVLILAGFAGLHPFALPWVYLGAVLAFEGWLFGIVRSVGGHAVPPDVAPYHFSDEEARLVTRYPFYFKFPGIAKHASTVLAAIGLTSLLLASWLTYRTAYVPAALAALNLLPVGWLTRRTAPLMALSLAANRGKRDAIELLRVHHTTWEKIRRCNIEQAKESAS